MACVASAKTIFATWVANTVAASRPPLSRLGGLLCSLGNLLLRLRDNETQADPNGHRTKSPALPLQQICKTLNSISLVAATTSEFCSVPFLSHSRSVSRCFRTSFSNRAI